jgi:hypothetical protein
MELLLLCGIIRVAADRHMGRNRRSGDGTNAASLNLLLGRL